MTPLPTYDRRHPAPVVQVGERRLAQRALEIIRRKRPIALTAALILVRPSSEAPRSSREKARGSERGARERIDARNEALAKAECPTG